MPTQPLTDVECPYATSQVSFIKYFQWRIPAKVVLSILVVLLFIIAVLLVFLSISQGKQIEDASFLNQHISWRDNCERTCGMKFDVPPLLVISMDGFRADYLSRELTPAVSRILNCGSRADYMYPSYPSKTFPNHFTIVTGLYPETHGIVDNHFVDFDMTEKYFSKSSRNPKWYNGEPIWNTVAKNGKKSATFFWPGSEVPVGGLQPTYRVFYNSSTPFSKRVDQVIEWLELPDGERPAFLGMYFEQPDAAGHNGGPDSDLVNSGLIYVDAMVNYLMYRLDKVNLLGCTNIVLLSDHGMQKLRQDHFIALEDYVNIKDPYVETFGGAIGNIHFVNKANLRLEDKMEKFACTEGNTFRAYTKRTIPKRYHYAAHKRIGDIVIDAAAGTEIFKTKADLRASKSMGDHGYDNRLRSMRALFGAYGPSVKRSKLVAPFQNIELYNLFTELMQLPYAAPNNGTKGLLYSIMKNPPALEETPMVDLPECPSIEMFKCGDGCRKFDVPKEDTKDQGTCHKLNRAQVPASYAEAEKSLCVVRFCNSTMVYDTTSNKVHCVESMLSAPIPNIDHRANCSIHLTASKENAAHDEEYYATGTEESSNSTLPPVDRCATMAHSRPSNTSWLTFFSDDDYARYITQGQLHVPSGFLEGIHKHLLDLIRQYQRHYKRLIMFSGPVYDEDNDGLRDHISPKDGPKVPTHLFVILLRCSGPWHRSLRYCEDPERTRTLAFLLPLVENDFNCLFPVEYLFRNTARVRDIELLTGLEWFTNRDVYPLEIAFRLRTQINEQLWQLENVGT